MEAVRRLSTSSMGGRNLRVKSKADIFSSFSYPPQPSNHQLQRYNSVDFCQGYTGNDPLSLICGNCIKPDMNQLRVGLELIIIFTKKECWILSVYESIYTTITPSRNKALSSGDAPISGNHQTSCFPDRDTTLSMHATVTLCHQHLYAIYTSVLLPLQSLCNYSTLDIKQRYCCSVPRTPDGCY